MTKKRSTDIRTCPVCGHPVQRSDMQFTLYKQAGNSIAVPIFESIFRKIILGEEKRKKDDSERQEGDAGR